MTLTTLALSKHFLMTCKWQEEHNWTNDKGVFMTDTDWVGKRVGIAGYGSIGRQGRWLAAVTSCREQDTLC